MQKLSILGVVLLFLYGCSSHNDIPYGKFAHGSTKAQIIANLGKARSEQLNYISQNGIHFSACFDQYGLFSGIVSEGYCPFQE